MVVLYFHTPKKIISVDTDTVTDEELAEINVTRESFREYLEELMPRDLAAEIDELKVQVSKLKTG